MNGTKYCKFCDKEKPIKEFCKSGRFVQNMCKQCRNEKQTKIYQDSKLVERLHRENQLLQQKVNQLETNRDEAIKLMRKKSKLVKKKELSHFAFYDMQMDDVSEVLEILERGKES